jgi:EAL domain-containing protein (putative c-di-GMP-specific phosphodiesterase class I)
MEALVRWEHPEHGLLLPSDFVPIAEETGLIFHIGQRVWRRPAARRECGRSNAPVTHPADVCEPPAWQFQHPELAQDIARVLRDYRERHDEGRAVYHCHASGVEGPGVKFAIDDFGTGYSSLLPQALPGQLREDQPLVRRRTQGRARGHDARVGHNLARACSGHAGYSGGVETVGQLARLRDGVQYSPRNYFFESVSGEQ